MLGIGLLVLGCDGSLEQHASGAHEAAPADGSATPQRPTRPEILEALRADLAAVRHPADGAGRAWLEADGDEIIDARVDEPGTWTVVFETGPRGVAVGGSVFLQISPFWRWSTPQVEAPSAPGFTRVDTDAEGVTLELATLDQGLLAARIGGRPLDAGERLRFVYGAGTAGAEADRYAERGERFWVAVDGDGDGVRGVLESSPRLDVAPGAPARVVVQVPSTARPGETLRAGLALLDISGSAYFERAVDPTSADEIQLGLRLRLERLEESESGDAWVTMDEHVPSLVQLDAEGLANVELEAPAPGIYRLHATSRASAPPPAFDAVSNPLLVAAAPRRIAWGDLQNHSNLSDGTGRPAELLRYARDVARLDVVAITDHDHWGMLFLDQRPAVWRAVQETTERFDDPGRFVAVRGYEWTNWTHGHRHVLFFDALSSEGAEPLFSSVDEATDHPSELWDALAALGPERRILTVSHHSAGGPIATDWSIAPDPRFEPVTEVVSVHGSSEAADAPHPIYRAVAGNFVRDALARGHRLGLLGSSDGHDGHPGLGHLASGISGLAAIHSEELTRGAVYDALQARDVYATSGKRILLRAVYGGWPMGADVPVADGAARPAPDGVDAIPADRVFVQVVGTAPVERIDVIRLPPDASGSDRPTSGRLTGQLTESVTAIDCEGRIQCRALIPVDEPRPGGLLYVRAVQTDGFAAWSSPFFFVEP